MNTSSVITNFKQSRRSGRRSDITARHIIHKRGFSMFDFIKAIDIKVISIPRELYLFEKSLYTYGKISGDPFAEPIYINGNIKGGNGIFALCRSRELKITFSPWI